MSDFGRSIRINDELAKRSKLSSERCGDGLLCYLLYSSYEKYLL